MQHSMKWFAWTKKWGCTMISAVLDACVLYPVAMRGFLLRLGTAELVRPLWSEKIQNEWTRNLLQNRSDLSREKLERTRRSDLPRRTASTMLRLSSGEVGRFLLWHRDGWCKNTVSR
jgi:hypothetical protein